MLKESYNVAAKENEDLNKKVESTKVHNAMLESQIEDMKIVIAKLADARVILNKYFTTHYETFTEEEKRLIAEIEGNIFPEYYNSGLNIPEVKPLTLNTEKTIGKNLKASLNFNSEQENQVGGISELTGKNKNSLKNQNDFKSIGVNNLNNSGSLLENKNKNFNRNKNNNTYKSTGRIMNAEEYELYQQKLKQEAPPQLSSENRGQVNYSKNIGPDDEYWHDNK